MKLRRAPVVVAASATAGREGGAGSKNAGTSFGVGIHLWDVRVTS